MSYYIDINDYQAFSKFSRTLEDIIKEQIPLGYDCIIFLCIGTDRSTGDSLGPLIGYKLQNLRHNNIYVYGTLDSPVHAKNLVDILSTIKSTHINPFIIAIDACLGSMDHVGFISISDGPLKPGSGVNKVLPEVGNIAVTGIVNFGGFMDFLILQNTRLSIVMKMADLISLGIKHTLWKVGNNQDFAGLGAVDFSTKQLALD